MLCNDAVMMMMITGVVDVDCAVVADQLTACKVENVGSVSSLSLGLSCRLGVNIGQPQTTDSTQIGHSPLYAALPYTSRGHRPMAGTGAQQDE